jgi:hypothetical protein
MKARLYFEDGQEEYVLYSPVTLEFLIGKDEGHYLKRLSLQGEIGKPRGIPKEGSPDGQMMGFLVLESKTSLSLLSRSASWSKFVRVLTLTSL